MLLLCVVVGKSCAEAVTSAEEQGCQGLKMEGGEGEDEEEGEVHQVSGGHCGVMKGCHPRSPTLSVRLCDFRHAILG